MERRNVYPGIINRARQVSGINFRCPLCVTHGRFKVVFSVE